MRQGRVHCLPITVSVPPTNLCELLKAQPWGEPIRCKARAVSSAETLEVAGDGLAEVGAQGVAAAAPLFRGHRAGPRPSWRPMDQVGEAPALAAAEAPAAEAAAFPVEVEDTRAEAEEEWFRVAASPRVARTPAAVVVEVAAGTTDPRRGSAGGAYVSTFFVGMYAPFGPTTQSRPWLGVRHHAGNSTSNSTRATHLAPSPSLVSLDWCACNSVSHGTSSWSRCSCRSIPVATSESARDGRPWRAA